MEFGAEHAVVAVAGAGEGDCAGTAANFYHVAELENIHVLAVEGETDDS